MSAWPNFAPFTSYRPEMVCPAVGSRGSSYTVRVPDDPRLPTAGQTISELCPFHIVQAGNGLPRGRQPRIVGHPHGVRVEVGGRDRQIVLHREVHQPATVVPGFDRHTPQDFLLDGGSELPVARSHAPAAEQRRIV